MCKIRKRRKSLIISKSRKFFDSLCDKKYIYIYLSEYLIVWFVINKGGEWLR